MRKLLRNMISGVCRICPISPPPDFLDDLFDGLEVDRFDDEGCRAMVEDIGDDFVVVLGRDDDDVAWVVPAFESLEHGFAVDLRHDQVEEQDVIAVGRYPAQAFAAVCDNIASMTEADNDPAEGLANVRIVIGDEDMKRRSGHDDA